MEESRLKKASRNVSYTLVVQALTYLCTFLGRTVFIRCLSREYLGAGGLFGNILSVLALAELGIGVAMNYFLYKPLADHDERSISAYMNFYARAYRGIGCFVLAAGFLLTPFLHQIIKDGVGIPHLSLIYMLYVLSAGATYFFSYKRSIFIADQNGYVDTLNQLYLIVVQTVVQSIVLIMTRNFILYLIVQVILVFLFNILISVKADRKYPFLKHYKHERLEKEKKRELFRYIGAMMSHKFGAVVINGTDNIIISSMVSIVSTGIYSNYNLLVVSIQKIISQIYSAVMASVGNLNATSNLEHKRIVFNRVYFINRWMTCFCTVSFWVLFQPFIRLWAGAAYLLEEPVVLVIVLNFYLRAMGQPVQSFKIASGLFWNDRYRPIAEAVINLVASIWLVQVMGIAGVFWGTAIGALTTNFWVEPYVLFKHGLKKSSLGYYWNYVQNAGLTILLCYSTNWVANRIPLGGIVGFILQCGLCLLIPNAVLLLLYFRTDEFRYYMEIVKVALRKFSHRRK